MISLLIFTLAVFGATFCIGASKISLPFRTWLAPDNEATGLRFFVRRWLIALVECPACTSFHLGWLSVLLGVAPICFHGVGGVVIASFYCCATSLLLARLAGLDEP